MMRWTQRDVPKAPPSHVRVSTACTSQRVQYKMYENHYLTLHWALYSHRVRASGEQKKYDHHLSGKASVHLGSVRFGEFACFRLRLLFVLSVLVAFVKICHNISRLGILLILMLQKDDIAGF